MTKPLRAIFVEDSERDAAILSRELQRGGYELQSERVDTAAALSAALDRQSWDIVLSDYSMPQFSASAALSLVRGRGFDVPFIIVSGTISEETAVEAMRAGANDFMSKNAMARLVPAIDRELREASARAERKKMREQLLIAERMASVGMLSASVAHEINNPLAVIVANLDFVLQQFEARGAPSAADSDPTGAVLGEISQPLREAYEAAERVTHIVRDLKVFSRSTDDEQQGAVDIERVLESALRMASNEVRHRARLVRRFASVAPVQGNEGRLGQVFLNLIVNAAQAIPEGHAGQNTITVSIRPGEHDRVLVEVSDSGTGMSAETMSRIFDPFFTTKAEGIGTGLGLAICHNIVTRLGGEISVDSTPGQGTTFRVSLLQAQPVAAPSGTREAEPLQKRRGRILVVDDEPMLCATVERILAAEHDVTAVTSAKKAIDMVRSGDRFDVILTDLMMPEMTGIELHAALTQISPDLGERIVFMTGGTLSPGASEFLGRSEIRTVDKPFNPATQRRAVQELIS